MSGELDDVDLVFVNMGFFGDSDNGSDEYQSRREERMFDGSRDYAHPYREHGRWGSHSTYDDYGEDSEV